MRRRRKLLIGILVMIIIGLVIVIGGALFLNTDSELSTGERNILVCAIDESEPRPGMGAVDMAFVVYLNNSNIVNYTTIYPHGMVHPNASEPQEAQAQGAGSQLLLHDSFWDSDTQQSMRYAEEIVEYNTNISIDAVVAVNTEALDAVIQAGSPLEVNGQTINTSGIDIIREEQNVNGSSRGDAVLDVVHGLANSASDPLKRSQMVSAALDQYSKGNIVMYPEGSFVNLLASQGIEALFS